jgi:hypothetical protein
MCRLSSEGERRGPIAIVLASSGAARPAHRFAQMFAACAARPESRVRIWN